MSSLSNDTWEISWTDELSVGIQEIDEEHIRFVELVNQLNWCILDRGSPAEIKKILQEILMDAESHFAHEENLFREWKFPHADRHAKMHNELLTSLCKAYGAINLESIDMVQLIKTGLEIKQALVTHLLEADMEYRDYYRDHIANISKRGGEN